MALDRRSSSISLSQHFKKQHDSDPTTTTTTTTTTTFGKEALGWLDRLVACILMGSISAIYFFHDVSRLLVIVVGLLDGSMWDNPEILNEVAQIFSVAVNFALMVLLWVTFSFRSDFMHRLWRTKLPGMSTPIMAGGFTPRASALSVGVMLFLSGAVLSEKYVYPANFSNGQAFTGLQSHWSRAQVCRGIGVRLPDAYTRVFTPAAIAGCFGEGRPFNEATLDNATAHGVDVGRHRENQDNKCLYMCFVWQNFGVDSLVRNMGIITSGAAFVVALSDSLSTTVGLRFAHADSTPEELAEHFRHSGTSALKGSAMLCAIQVLLVLYLRRFLAKWTDDNGPQSPSFCVALVLWQSLITTTYQRFWSPFLCRPIIYTKNLWQTGKDTFFEADDNWVIRPVDVDLYEWIHLSNAKRCAYLFHYAKRAGFDIKKGAVVTLLEEHSDKKYVKREIDLIDGPLVLLEAVPILIPRDTVGIVQEIVGDKIKATWLLDHDAEEEAIEFDYSWKEHSSKSILHKLEDQRLLAGVREEDWFMGLRVRDRHGKRLDYQSALTEGQFPICVKVWKVVESEVPMWLTMQAGDEWDDFANSLLDDSKSERGSLTDPLLPNGP